MRAALIRAHGGPEAIEIAELPDPEPGPGQVLVDVAAAGVNFVDVYHRTGAYPNELPLQLGTEAAGTVAAVGSGVTGVAVGDRVAWAMRPGAYATRAVIAADVAVPVPDGVTDEVAAAVLLQGMTAQYLTTATYPVQAGDTVLVHAAAGGTGALIVQLAVRRGATVLATTSTEEKAALARAHGCHYPIVGSPVDVLPPPKQQHSIRVVGYEGVDQLVRVPDLPTGLHRVATEPPPPLRDELRSGVPCCGEEQRGFHVRQQRKTGLLYDDLYERGVGEGCRPEDEDAGGHRSASSPSGSSSALERRSRAVS